VKSTEDGRRSVRKATQYALWVCEHVNLFLSRPYVVPDRCLVIVSTSQSLSGTDGCALVVSELHL
jgi:hypothetical protein